MENTGFSAITGTSGITTPLKNKVVTAEEIQKKAKEIEIPEGEYQNLVIQCDKIFNLYLKNKEGILVSRFSQEEMGLTKDQLLHIITAAYKTGLTRAESVDYFPLKAENTELLAKFKEKKIKLVDLTRSTVLGEGSHAIAKAVSRLDIPQMLVFKSLRMHADVEKQARTLEEFLNEQKILTELWKGEKKENVVGIQALPKYIIPANSESHAYGSLMTMYDTDLFAATTKAVETEEIGGKKEGVDISEPLLSDVLAETYLDGIEQLLTGLKFSIKKGIFHGDIKEDNILLKIEDNEKILWHLADWGGAKNIDQLKDIIEKNMPLHIVGTCSKDYFSKNEMRELITAAQEKNLPKVLELNEKRNILALGITIYQSIAKVTAFPTKDSGDFIIVSDYEEKEIGDKKVPLNFDVEFPSDPSDPNSSFRNLAAEFGNDFVLWLAGLLEANTDKRFTAEEALNKFLNLECVKKIKS